MPIQVRSAELSDIPTLIEMMREFYAESGYPLDSDWATRSFRALLSERANGGVWLAWRDGIPAGYVVLTTRFSMEFGGRDGFIDDLFVRPKCRRAGVGRALVGTLLAESKARGLLALHVEVDPQGVAANALYGGFGMHDKGRRLLTAAIEPASRLASNTSNDVEAAPGSGSR